MRRSPRVDRNRVSVARRRARALELRTQGYTLRAIASELGMSGPEAARKLVDGGIREIVSPKVNDLRKELDERARLLLEELSPVIVAVCPTCKGRRIVKKIACASCGGTGKGYDLDARLAAMDRIIKIDRELRAMHGVDAPTQSVNLNADLPAKDVRGQLLDRLSALAAAAATSEGDPKPDG